MINDNQLVTAFGELVEAQRWDIFLTATFRRSIWSIEARRTFRHFFKHLNTESMIFYEKFILALTVFEKNVDRSGVHIHSFIQGINPSYATPLEKRCRAFFGDSKALPYDPTKGAKFYVGRKYASSQLDDFDFLRVNSKLRGHTVSSLPIAGVR